MFALPILLLVFGWVAWWEEYRQIYHHIFLMEGAALWHLWIMPVLTPLLFWGMWAEARRNQKDKL